MLASTAGSALRAREQARAYRGAARAPGRQSKQNSPRRCAGCFDNPLKTGRGFAAPGHGDPRWIREVGRYEPIFDSARTRFSVLARQQAWAASAAFFASSASRIESLAAESAL